MNFLAFDSVPLKSLAVHLKDSPPKKNEMNSQIIPLYGSFGVETKYQNNIARNK